MSYFTVNIANQSSADSVTVSPVKGSGFGCCVPPRGTMNFSFQSVGESDSITLALMLLSDNSDESARICDVQTDGGLNRLSGGDGSPNMLEITNLGDRSVTNVVIGNADEKVVPENVDDGVTDLRFQEVTGGNINYSFDDFPPMIVN